MRTSRFVEVVQRLMLCIAAQGVMREGITAAISLLPDLVELNLISCTNLGDTVLPAVSALTGALPSYFVKILRQPRSEPAPQGHGGIPQIQNLCSVLELANHALSLPLFFLNSISVCILLPIEHVRFQACRNPRRSGQTS